MDYTKHPLKIFFSYYKPHVGLFIADMICAFFMAAIDVVFPMFTRYALNTLIPNHQLRTFLILVAILFAGFCLHKAVTGSLHTGDMFSEIVLNRI